MYGGRGVGMREECGQRDGGVWWEVWRGVGGLLPHIVAPPVCLLET